MLFKMWLCLVAEKMYVVIFIWGFSKMKLRDFKLLSVIFFGTVPGEFLQMRSISASSRIAVNVISIFLSFILVVKS